MRPSPLGRALAGLLCAASLAAAGGCAGSTKGSASAPATQAKPSASPSRDAGPPFAPSSKDKDPTKRIDGVLDVDYVAGKHVSATQRVAYDHTPPLGGAHDQVWAPCNGEVYPAAVRTENLVHSMEHGAVWITYDPQRVAGDDLAALAGRVEGKPYLVMSPFPGQPTAVSAQSWGRQLQVDSVDDERLDQFVQATRRNPYLTPEPGASCDPVDPALFDPANPPPFDPSPPGPGAVPPTGQ